MNRVFVIDNFRRTTGFGVKGFKTLKTKIDKGHKEQFRQLVSGIEKGSGPLIPFIEQVNSSLASFAALDRRPQIDPRQSTILFLNQQLTYG